ncbi:YciI family protein [Streptomyces sp. NPDC102395]|uniref:YciI family protein n=1 Tax=Streptomyces sp. NPDC102395 TaxID=3366168 RepID=UPI0038115F75
MMPTALTTPSDTREDTMLHLLQLHYTATEQDAGPFVPAHVAYLERHHVAGTFLVSGQSVPTEDGGAIIAHGVDRATIEQITAQDPFVTNGVAKYTITTITPGRAHPALADILTRGH